MSAPTGRKASVSGDRERDLGHRSSTELLGDAVEHEDDDEEVEGVERPAEEAGDDGVPGAAGLFHSRLVAFFMDIDQLLRECVSEQLFHFFQMDF